MANTIQIEITLTRKSLQYMLYFNKGKMKQSDLEKKLLRLGYPSKIARYDLNLQQNERETERLFIRKQNTNIK